MYWILTLMPIGLLALGFPVFVVLLLTSAVVLTFFVPIPIEALHQRLFSGIDKYALLAVPFFIFAGELMSSSSTSRRIVDWVMSLTGGARGNLAFTTIGTCVVFGAISGSSQATVSAIGRILYAPLRNGGYSAEFSNGLLASTGAMAVVIPPSISMILYGVASNTSVTKLFIAGILPGFVMAACFVGYVLLSREIPQRSGRKADLRTIGKKTWQGLGAIGSPVIILGGIYGGIFSPTEAAGVACIYVMLLAGFLYRDVGLRQIWDVTVRAMYLTAQVFLIVAAASAFSWVLTVVNVPQDIVHLISDMDLSNWQLLLAINIVLLIVGCFIDTPSAILVMTPLLAPVAAAAGIDLIHLGIIVTVNLAIGFFTPPFGINLFVVQALFKEPVSVIYRGVAPFIAVNLLSLALITYVPPLSLWLVD
ncbi:MAG: TRAP transporter large permease [Rhodospirillaceae bacterium]|nr:TRAP transporter large permease [Rhodospirillaceae bacterium]